MICVLLLALSPLAAAQTPPAPVSELVKVSDSLYLYRDTCNVYAVKAGDSAVLIDFGSGGVLQHLPSIGVKKVDWVLHTHYHRDQCQGDQVLAGLGIKVAVPADQRALFEDAEKAWKKTKLYHNYSFKPDFLKPARSVKVDMGIKPGETFDWRALRFKTLPCVGHTQAPGLIYLVDVDGKRTAFTGDLIHSPGKLWTYYELQWKYNQLKGAQAELDSLDAVKKAGPELLLPSHGVVVREPQAAIDETTANLKEVMELLRWQPHQDRTMSNKRIFPHVFHRRTSFVIIADSGHALFYDSSFQGSLLDSFIEELKRDGGLKQVDMILLSHYHDDHVSGIPDLKNRYGAKLWVHECTVDIIENPYRYNIPCLGVERYPAEVGPKVDRVLRDNETFEWEGYKFTVFHFPGQTEYHIGMYAEIDGHRMLFMGDSTYRPAVGTVFRGENFNCRNYCRLGEGTGYLRCGELIRKWNPDMAMAAHFGAIPLDEKRIDEYYQWARKLEPAFRKLIARDDPNFGTDPNRASFYPYRLFAEAGETVSADVRIRNHSDHDAAAKIVPVLPDGWSVEPAERSITIGPRQTAVAKFNIILPEDNPVPLRTVITANIVFDATDFGELAEMLIDSRSEKDKWMQWYMEEAGRKTAARKR